MAFPTVQARSNGTASASSLTVSLPTGSADGDLIVVLLQTGSQSTTWTLNAGSSGWTELFDTNGHACYYKVIGASEANPTFDLSVSERSSYSALRIDGFSGTPSVGTEGTGTSNAPDPAASPTPGGTDDHLFIATCGGDDGRRTVSGAPTNYSNLNTNTSGGGGGGCYVATAERQLNTGSAQDPGTFSASGSANWSARTILVNPASGTTHQGAGSVNGSATVTASATLRTQGDGAVSGAATVTAAATLRTQGAGSIDGSATVTADGLRTAFGAGSADGSATVIAAATLRTQGAGSIDGSATAVAAATYRAQASCAVSGSATVTAAATLRTQGAGSITGTATVTADGTVGGTTHQGTASISASATVTANGLRKAVGAGSVSASATVTAAATAIVRATAAITGTAAAVAASTMIMLGTAAVTASATVTADGTLPTLDTSFKHVIEDATGDLLRAGYSPFVAGAGESIRTDGPIPASPLRPGRAGDYDNWTGSQWVKVPQPKRARGGWTMVMATANYTAKDGEFICVIAGASETIEITLPDPIIAAQVAVKQVGDPTGFAKIITPDAAKVEAAADMTLAYLKSAELNADGVDWWMLAGVT